ncbi:hypothetical protein E5K00_06370 [Hymenobacter aquaticus]|uniref:Uncharacterized protein n=1 Tax=Hymenobacter aquaticus TaxID=1867101 RepID=A0A4Z0Q5D8_9BACT|nr:hypothetical protein [Hymenobacter aquaticus]TGE24824.1 hypothetical protein E5K00_06370 [Hymenobacter aquaticus]
MGRRAYHSNSLSAQVRRHFSLTQAELAQFVGVSAPMLAMAESGRKALGKAADNRLWVLARLLPPPDGQGPEAPAPAAEPVSDPAAPPEAAVLEQRLSRLRFYVIKARFELGQRGTLAQGQARRRWAQEVLRPLLAAPPVEAVWLGADPARDLYWLEGLVIHTNAAPLTLSATERALRQARLRGLEAEVAALEQALAPNT